MRVEAAGIQIKAADAAGRLNPSYSRRLQLAAMKSRFMRAMTSSLIQLGADRFALPDHGTASEQLAACRCHHLQDSLVALRLPTPAADGPSLAL